VAPNERVEEPIGFGAARARVFERVVAPAGRARIWLLVRVERRIPEEAVFDVVDSDVRCFLVGDRT